MKRIAVILALCASLTYPVHAAALSDIDKKLLIISVTPVADFREFTPEKRISVAQLLHDYWVEFDAAIPRNLPSEQSWLEKELSTSNGERLSRALNTAIYARSRLVDQAEDCVKNTELLRDQINGGKDLELYAWIRILGCYKNTYDLTLYLQNAGLSNGRYDGPVPILHSSSLQGLISGAIANAVITGSPDIVSSSGQKP